MLPAPAEAILVRRLDAADAAAYGALRLESLRTFPHAHRPDYEEARMQPLSSIEERLAKPGDYWFGAFVDGQLVGALGLSTEEGQRTRHSAGLKALVVAGSRQRQGIGTALLGHVVAFARSLGYIRQLTLTVLEGNTGAERLYDAFGFERFGIEPDAVLHEGRYLDKQFRQLVLK